MLHEMLIKMLLAQAAWLHNYMHKSYSVVNQSETQGTERKGTEKQTYKRSSLANQVGFHV